MHCVYCGDPVKGGGEGDHVVPDRFGRFERQLLFKRICRGCNSKIGAFEEQLVRCGPEATLLSEVNPKFTRRASDNRRLSAGAKGMPAPEFFVQHADHRQRAFMTSDGQLIKHDQIVVVDRQGGERSIRLDPRITEIGLRQSLNRAEVDLANVLRVYVSANSDSYLHYIDLICKFFPGCSVIHGPTQEPGIHAVKVEIKHVIGMPYWQSYAKIAFHYFLLNTRRGYRGDEVEFAPIRDFIMCGGDEGRFFVPPQMFNDPESFVGDCYGVSPARWMHRLMMSEEEGAITVGVQLFLGPRRVPKIVHLQIAKLPTPLFVPGARTAHLYVYDRQLEEHRCDGYVERSYLMRR